MTLIVRLIVTVTVSFTLENGSINGYIIITIVVGIFIFWSFTTGVYKVYLSALEVFYLLNICLLSTVNLASSSLKFKHYQIATIVSVFSPLCLSFLYGNSPLVELQFKNLKKLGMRDQSILKYLRTAVEDDKEDRAL